MEVSQVTDKTGDLRAKILAIYGINEEDPDWIALNTSDLALAEDAARAEQEQFRDVVIPARIVRVEAELNATLPAGITVKYERK